MARNQIDPDRMSRAELEEYVKNLPEEKPPKMSSAIFLAAFGVVLLILFFNNISIGNFSKMTWFMLGGGIASIIGAGYLVYRVNTYNRKS